MEKYSVLMSLYKKEKPEYLRTALDSMINQTVKPDEIILVEDGPLTDELYHVLKEYGEHLTRVVNEKNMGLGLSLAKGLVLCRNELVARMDTDDISISNRCEMQIKYFEENKDKAIVGGQIAEFIGDASKVVGIREVPCKDEKIREYIKKRCPFNHMSVMFRKSDVLEAGNYQNFFCNEDYYLWIKMALMGKKFANLPEILVKVRVGNEMYMRRGGRKYYESEKDIQKYMLENQLISKGRFLINILERFVVQLLLPNRLRALVFKNFARNKNGRKYECNR